jgi:DNA-directed RNA polymerase sigma subunit (sigma70/sigma32)
MLSVYLDQCAPIAAYLDVTSLNAPIESDVEGVDDVEIIDTLPDLSPTPEDGLISQQLKGKLRAFVASLSPRLAEIVRRHYWLDQNQSDIAADLGVTRSAVCHALASVNRKGLEFFGVAVH